MTGITQAEAENLIHLEGRFLDEHRFDDWLNLYAEDAVYWVPAWKNESETTGSPDTELSLIYYEGRTGLADRIWRLKSGLSPASAPMRRTAHMVSGIILGGQEADGASAVKATFCVFQYDPKRSSDHVFFGHYEYQFRRTAEGWCIARKKTVLANDQIPAVADLYLL